MADHPYTPAPAADFVLPFDLPQLGLRGRLTRLDAVSTRALASRPLAEPAQQALAEAMALSAMLGSALRIGRLSLQTKSDGPMDMLTVDYWSTGGMRGYARLDEKRLAVLVEKPNFGTLAGEGALAITIEAKLGDTPYQGLVPLSPKGLSASAETYFESSEQLPTLLKLAAGPIYRAGTGNGWCAGGIMIQALPESEVGDVRSGDDWRRVEMFLQTLEDVELLDASISAEDVLWRLFHEDEVRVHPARALHFECTCREERIGGVLKAYPMSELTPLADADGIIRPRCEFCGRVYEFPLETMVG